MKQKLIYLAIMLSLTLAACGILQTKIAPRAAAIVSLYCSQPQPDRLIVREQVAALTGANHIEIHCAGDLPSAESSR